MFAMGSFYTLTVHQGYANYLVSETGVVLGITYIIISVLFSRVLIKRDTPAGPLKLVKTQIQAQG
jgi:hypothetical protein